MLDFNAPEFLVVGIVALLVIGPKDLPKALRLLGKWVGRARGVARQFRTGFDTMVRESELAEMEKQWKAENERIMREFPTPQKLIASQPESAPDAVPEDPGPVMVEQPVIAPEPEPEPLPVSAPKPPRRRAPRTGDTIEAQAPDTGGTIEAPKPRAPRKPRAKAQS